MSRHREFYRKSGDFRLHSLLLSFLLLMLLCALPEGVCLAQQDTTGTFHSFRILPDSPPLGFRYRVVTTDRALHTEVDTIDVLFIKPLTGVEVHYCVNPDYRYGNEDDWKVVEDARGWAVMGLFEWPEGWIETPLGLFDVYVGPEIEATDMPSDLKVPSCSDSLRRWRGEFRDICELVGSPEIEFDGRLYEGRVVTSIDTATGEERGRSEWALGLGPVSVFYTDLSGTVIRAELIEILPSGRDDLVRTLYLCNVDFSRENLEFFLRFTGARRLYFYGSAINDSLLTCFASFNSLRVLDLDHTSIAGRSLHEFDLRKLEELRLSMSMVNDELIKSLPRLPSLRKISLRNTCITDVAVRKLISSPGIEELHLGNTVSEHYRRHTRSSLFSERDDPRVRTHITDRSCSWIAKMKELCELDLSNTLVTDAGIRRLRRLKNLRSLDLSCTRITDKALSTLACLDQLEELDLSYTLVTDDGMRLLAPLPRLKRLALNGTLVGDGGLARLAGKDSLMELTLRHTRISDRGAGTFRTLRNLEILDLQGTKVTEASKEILRRLPCLTELRASWDRNDLMELLAGISDRMVKK